MGQKRWANRLFDMVHPYLITWLHVGWRTAQCGRHAQAAGVSDACDELKSVVSDCIRQILAVVDRQ